MMKPLRSFACACALALCSASSQAATFGDFEYEESESGVTITDYAGSATTLEIPAAINGKPVTAIGKRAFYNCDTLTSVIIPDSVTTIDKDAFRDCDAMTSITIPDSVTAIGTGVFYGNDSMTSAIIGNNVTTIDASAFAQCQKLTSVTIGDGVTTIDNLAFSYCFDLRSLTLPDGLTTIGDSAFAWSGLTSMKFPDSVTTIGSLAFANCRLTSITIPDSVTAIGTNAFAQCSLLAEIVFTGAPPTYETPGDWNGKVWKYPTWELEAWQAAIAKAEAEGRGIVFESFDVMFDETVPEAEREWLREALVAQGLLGSVTVVGDTSALEAFRVLGMLPQITQDGTAFTLNVKTEAAFAALREAIVAGEIYGKAQLTEKVDEQVKAIALTAPLIEVGADDVTVEIGVQTAETLGEWQPAEMATVEMGETGTLRVRLAKPKGSNAAFYKFVVPDGLQKATDASRR